MGYPDKLARLAYFVLLLLLAATVGGTGWLIASRAMPGSGTVDAQTGTAGLKVETDAGTGCQYVVTPWGGIFARLGPDGKPLCGSASH